MYQRASHLILRLLRVPPEPQPPHGDPASLRIFRAGPNFLKLRLLKWSLAQSLALVGIVFWFGVFSDLDEQVEHQRARLNPPTPAAPVTGPAPEPGHPAPAERPPTRSKPSRRSFGPLDGFRAGQYATAVFLARLPKPAMLVIWFFEIAGLILYVLQLPVTFLLARLDYELRWYMVTDRSLRIRHGLWKVSESTMSFANIQQVVVSQGPLQRILNLADVKVQSAGGGSGDKPHERGEEDMHHGLFHSVTNASEIRDLIQRRLRRYRESGLGDPEERTEPAASASASNRSELLAAARELADEARAWRGALG